MIDVAERRKYYEDMIPPIYTGEFPSDFSLSPDGWVIPEDVVNRPDIIHQFSDGPRAIRPISTMDVEFLDNRIVAAAKNGDVDLVKNYPCGLNCPGCFSEAAVYGDTENLMTWQEMFGVIDQARAIGLHSIKFLGPGEIFNNMDLFDILDACEERGLYFSIFTKGVELGDDAIAASLWAHRGIHSSADLVNKIAEYKTVRILLGFNSFDPGRQNKMVGSSASRAANYTIEANGVFSNRGISDYTTKRDNALLNLIRAGFNDPAKGGQRLSLIATPTGLNQIDEAPDMLVWGARRNMPVIIAPTMESGDKSVRLTVHNQRIDSEHQQFVALFVAVYKRALKEGIITPEQIRHKGISAYAGTDSCQQVANGLLTRLNGLAQMCPGNSDPSSLYGNVHRVPFADIWVNSPNYRMGRMINNWCTAKKHGMPAQAQAEIAAELGL